MSFHPVLGVARYLTGERGPAAQTSTERAYRGASMPVFAEIAFAGLDLAPPGVVLVSEWRREGSGPRPFDVSFFIPNGRVPCTSDRVP